MPISAQQLTLLWLIKDHVLSIRQAQTRHYQPYFPTILLKLLQISVKPNISTERPFCEIRFHLDPLVKLKPGFLVRSTKGVY